MYNTIDIDMDAQIINNAINDINESQKSYYINILMNTYLITSCHAFEGSILMIVN